MTLARAVTDVTIQYSTRAFFVVTALIAVLLLIAGLILPRIESPLQSLLAFSVGFALGFMAIGVIPQLPESCLTVVLVTTLVLFNVLWFPTAKLSYFIGTALGAFSVWQGVTILNLFFAACGVVESTSSRDDT